MLWPVFWESAHPRPSIRALGRSKKSRSAPGSRVRGNIGLWLCWRGKHPFAPRDFWALVVVRGVSVCSSQPVFQPGVVQAVRPPSPRSAFARVSGWAVRFRFWLNWRAYCRHYPRPNPALKGSRGYALACFP